jgi:mRNA interferase MazF
MPPTTGYSFGGIVLVAFPFTNQSATKRRPAVVASSGRYHADRPDLIIMAVTSQTRPTVALGEVQLKDRQAAGLIKPSAVKPLITTIEVSLVIRRPGQLTEVDRSALREALAAILG